jgi:hypothetical protein
MPMLGDMLAAARGSSAGFDRWLAAADPAFAAEVAEAAGRENVSVGAFARMAVHDFAAHAGEEDWATLVSRMRDDSDPGRVCLLAMVHWRLHVSGCAAHSHAHARCEGAIDA